MRGPRASRVLYVAVAATLAALAPTLAGAAKHGPVQVPGTALSTNYDFARLVLADGGWRASANNVTVLTQWLRAEEPPEHWWNRDNPLNNGLGSGGGSGLGSYGSLVTAAFDVARNLARTAYGYPLVAHDLSISADPSATARAIWRSHWAEGHYSFGASWATYPVPAYAAPATAWRSPTACPIRYPAGVVGPCGAGFSASGPAWHDGAPYGYRSEELFALGGRASAGSSARWMPVLRAGTYLAAAWVPARFADAEVAYVVTDARGAHRVLLSQEPYSDAWVPLGIFTSTKGTSIGVVLPVPSRGPGGATYVAADAMRFSPVRSTAALPGAPRVASRRTARPPGAPEAATAVPGDRSVALSWYAPSKDGGAHVTRYVVSARPSGRSCAATLRTDGRWGCTVQGLVDGTTYTFSVRAQNRAGLGHASAPSAPVRPLAPTELRVAPESSTLAYGERVVLRAFVGHRATGGTVLFFEDGRPIAGCTSAKVVQGRARCALRLSSTSHHVVRATFTGSRTLAGADRDLEVFVHHATISLAASAAPSQVTAGEVATLRAFSLPAAATGTVEFSSGGASLCVATVGAGTASCTWAASLGGGVHVIVARYVGDRDFAATTARTSIEILAASRAG